MSQLDEKVTMYVKNAEKLGMDLSADLIKKAAADLGPSLYSKDSETVSCGDETELETVKDKFLRKKLQLLNSEDELDTAIKKVCEDMGTSNRSKYRAIFYAQLMKDFGQA